MNSWIPIVPLKSPGTRKERLSEALGQDERDALAAEMFDHVLSVLIGHPRLAVPVIVSPTRPEVAGIFWMTDQGRGLNAELTAARDALGGRNLFVIHADLPHLAKSDIDALLDAGEQWAAIAPDEAGTGTNALVPAPGQPFRFGPGSFELHRADAPLAEIVRTPGLAFDVDDPAHLARYRAAP